MKTIYKDKISMDNNFKEGFDKTARLNYLVKTIPKAARSVGMKSRRTPVGDLAGAASSAAKSKAKAGAGKAVSSRSSSGHKDYLKSIGAMGKKNPNADEVLKYKPSTTRAGLSEFESISKRPKTRTSKERGPLKK